MYGRRALMGVAVAGACLVVAAPVGAASEDHGRVVVTGALHRTLTDLHACESIELSRRVHVLALQFGPRSPALLSLKLAPRGALRDAEARGAWVTLAVPRDRNWATGPFKGPHGRELSQGAGTVTVAADGSTGTVHAQLAATSDAGTRYDPHARGVHVDATWHCSQVHDMSASGS